MKHHLFIYIFIIASGLFFLHSCDSTTSPKSPIADQPYISNLTINPDRIEFERNSDGLKDTTISINIEASFGNADEMISPRYTITNRNTNELISDGELMVSESNSDLFSATTEISTSTTSNEEFIINVTVNDSNNLYAQTILTVRGFPNQAPEIIFAENQESVQIPNNDNVIPVTFEAKVIDEDGQDNISGVFIEFLNENGSRLVPIPNELFDDGQNSNANDSGDLVAGDSVYTIRFFIDSTNTPNRRTAQYFAIDETGLSSDTVETTFNIIE